MSCEPKIQAFRPLESKLKDHGIKLIFISASTAAQIKGFLDTSVVDVCGSLYGDPSSALHKLFKLKRGVIRSLFSSIRSNMDKFGGRVVLKGVHSGFQKRHLAGDYWQQGGTILLDKEGNILYQHAENHPSDWPDMEEVFHLAGLAETSVDYQKAIADWLELTKNQNSSQTEQQLQSQ